MAKKSTQTTVAAIAASLMASLAPVPAQSTTLPVTAVEVSANHGVAASLTFNLPSGQIFLPLEEAADYLNHINDRQRFLLNALVRERQDKGKGPLFDKTAQMKRLCVQGLQNHIRIKEAVQMVMKSENLYKAFPGDLKQQAKYKADLLRFGRAVAQGEFILRDTLSLIEQSEAPESTVRLADMPADEEVKAWIAAEHKNLGLAV
ncbi:iron-sulfur cluster assembly scaffold protein SufA [Salmonella enterica]|uniref:Iron-sulfur cluster assembly scaffold protein SufA n=5 Tax=Salmonella enterica I TaxID=59201 RepID=A0A637L4J8_SALNE|nr:(Fe-S)-cluster assembly protein [Salmonella enterica]EAA1525762.1 iron-sulfur cluster assembly scaffold protein SufA [Salmonella enterica subsp. enterica serovar Tennessee]EAA3233829.1 iron-sulfur cluster assembly scaffold protein SufA [Salmonella enterica subsp. enterica serovar Fluntern]EAA5974375.1 iron-sulfur cluster assembly scaffold protein SufA [Salmonella enterica subsp. enterica serovar Napoli]EAB8458951.1 iron-sulfur cluster assembly scaffold protein SufA [Salmonella enterica subsp